MKQISVATLAERSQLKGGRMLDATITHAPPSTKTERKKRDPEMHQTKKGKDWCFGRKTHVGAAPSIRRDNLQ